MTKTREIIMAGLGGVAATATDVVVLMTLVALGVSIPVAAFLAASVGAIVSFSINKYVAFRDRSPLALEQLVRFGLVALANALALAFSMKLFAVELGVPVLPAKLLSAALVFFAWTYPAQKKLVFRRGPSAASSLA